MLESARQLRKNLALLEGIPISGDSENPSEDEVLPGEADDSSIGISEAPSAQPPVPVNPESGTVTSEIGGEAKEGNKLPEATSTTKRKYQSWRVILPQLVLTKPNTTNREILHVLIAKGHVDKNDRKQVAKARSAIAFYLQRRKIRKTK